MLSWGPATSWLESGILIKVSTSLLLVFLWGNNGRGLLSYHFADVTLPQSIIRTPNYTVAGTSSHSTMTLCSDEQWLTYICTPITVSGMWSMFTKVFWVHLSVWLSLNHWGNKGKAPLQNFCRFHLRTYQKCLSHNFIINRINRLKNKYVSRWDSLEKKRVQRELACQFDSCTVSWVQTSLLCIDILRMIWGTSNPQTRMARATKNIPKKSLVLCHGFEEHFRYRELRAPFLKILVHASFWVNKSAFKLTTKFLLTVFGLFILLNLIGSASREKPDFCAKVQAMCRSNGPNLCLPWGSTQALNSLCLNFLICKIGTVIVHIPPGLIRHLFRPQCYEIRNQLQEKNCKKHKHLEAKHYTTK